MNKLVLYCNVFILLYGELCERATWTKSRNVIGYPSGQDARSGLPAVSGKKIPRKPYTKFFIDQVCSVKMAGHLVNNPYVLYKLVGRCSTSG